MCLRVGGIVGTTLVAFFGARAVALDERSRDTRPIAPATGARVHRPTLALPFRVVRVAAERQVEVVTFDPWSHGATMVEAS